MSESSAPQAPAPLGQNRGIKFSFKTGNARYQCVLQDRNHERTKATRQNSSDSVSSTDSTKTEKSSH
ncbi:Ff.00g031550.m01.CDS01 [Fusarium sp. VM40]|nr:Ff.00g031550.m01.CDS01 [Fusarium sp. VM40]